MLKFVFWKLVSPTAQSCHVDEEVAAYGIASLRGTLIYLEKAVTRKRKRNICLGVSKIKSLKVLSVSWTFLLDLHTVKWKFSTKFLLILPKSLLFGELS